MENVKALVQKRFKPYFDDWVKRLAELGYTTYRKVLNATDYGIPQNRERVIAVSILDDDEGYDFPAPVPLELKLKDLLESEVDPKYYISAAAIKSKLNSGFTHRNRSILTGGGGEPYSNSEGVQGTDVCRTIRVGGRGSRDEKHRWDIIAQEVDEE